MKKNMMLMSIVRTGAMTLRMMVVAAENLYPFQYLKELGALKKQVYSTTN